MASITQITDETAVGRFLTDQLRGADAAAFEERLLRDRHAIEDLEIAARFKIGLLRLREVGELERTVHPEKRWMPRVVPALAASLAVAVVGMLTIRWEPDPTSIRLSASPTALVDRSGNALRLAPGLVLMRVRSAREDAVLAASAPRVAIPVRAMPEVPMPSAEYSIELSRAEGGKIGPSIATVGGLRVDAHGFVQAYIDSALLSPGRYRLVVSSREPASSASFLIRVEE